MTPLKDILFPSLSLPPELKELYLGKRVTFYQDLREVRPGIKASQVAAARDFLQYSQLAQLRGKSFVGALTGPMAAGKSTVKCLISREYTDVQAFKHAWDLKRGGADITNTNCPDVTLRIPAKHYTRVEQIIDQLGPEKKCAC